MATTARVTQAALEVATAHFIAPAASFVLDPPASCASGPFDYFYGVSGAPHRIVRTFDLTGAVRYSSPEYAWVNGVSCAQRYQEVAVAYNNGVGGQPNNYILTRDGGRNWSLPFTLPSIPGMDSTIVGFPAITQDGLWILWPVFASMAASVCSTERVFLYRLNVATLTLDAPWIEISKGGVFAVGETPPRAGHASGVGVMRIAGVDTWALWTHAIGTCADAFGTLDLAYLSNDGLFVESDHGNGAGNFLATGGQAWGNGQVMSADPVVGKIAFVGGGSNLGQAGSVSTWNGAVESQLGNNVNGGVALGGIITPAGRHLHWFTIAGGNSTGYFYNANDTLNTAIAPGISNFVVLCNHPLDSENKYIGLQSANYGGALATHVCIRSFPDALVTDLGALPINLGSHALAAGFFSLDGPPPLPDGFVCPTCADSDRELPVDLPFVSAAMIDFGPNELIRPRRFHVGILKNRVATYKTFRRG